MFRFLISGFFLLVPLGATIGILMGITSFRRANGQDPPFSGDPGDGLPGIVPKAKDMVLFACDVATGLHPVTNGEEFTMNPNPWGWTKGTPGHICMSVNQFGNKSYGDDKTAAPWNITWQYPQASNDLPVHAYANALVESKSLPAKLGDIKTSDFEVEWALSLKNDTLDDASDDELTQNAVNANVAIDMFLDKDSKLSTNQDEKNPAHYEVMVWFADIGPAAFPLGKTKAADEGVVTTATIGGYEFQLFAQKNENSQQVLSWVATKHAYTFKASLSEFMEAIYKENNPDYPSSTDYLGYVAFGQEAYSATNNVTFSVPKLRVDIST